VQKLDFAAIRRFEAAGYTHAESRSPPRNGSVTLLHGRSQQAELSY
jgi:hypothetical protein